MTPDDLRRVVRAEIHPAIGVARVGDSEDEYVLAPEISFAPPSAFEHPRDHRGALKRQAARFRVFGFDDAGAVVGEITADDAKITWTVEVANQKAAWFAWVIALDIGAGVDPIPRRNPNVRGAARDGLVIRPGPRSIEGRCRCAVPLEGSFQGSPVYLGELRTDDAGRLLFLGGRGVSRSPEPVQDGHLSSLNAPGWYDDTSDGPVRASVVTPDGRAIDVEAAWIVTAPPNYAPGLVSVRTLYDVLADLFALPAPEAPSFAEDIYPLLRRLTDLQWVNAGFAAQFGHGAPYDFADETLIAKLARDPKEGGRDSWRSLRAQVFGAFRVPGKADQQEARAWPWLDGDGSDREPAYRYTTLTKLQWNVLKSWACGTFRADWSSPRREPARLEKIPLAEQPSTLTRAALDHCIADAFHPGSELTWPMRHGSIYNVAARSPFRIKALPPGQNERDFGATLDPNTVLGADGPLQAQGPGGLTRWLAVPWQADAATCNSGFGSEFDPVLPTFWPARVPNQVISDESYEVIVDPNAPLAARVAAFVNRSSWNAALGNPDDDDKRAERMIEMFGSMPVLEPRPGVPGHPGLPPLLRIASTRPGTPPSTPRDDAVERGSREPCAREAKP